ncbi:MAG: hypothetical protein ACR2OZ_00750 [Verrucomicrobiales bacterium]
MRTPFILGALLAGFAASAFLASPATAQGTSSSTPVIGYYKFNTPNGPSLWTSGFVTRKEFQGQATSVTPGASSTINQTGAGWTAGAFNLHYVEILDGLQAGLVLDILGNSATSLTVDGEAGPAGFNLAQTVKYAVRKHSTLGSIFKGGAGGLSPFEDSITLFYDDGSKKSFYYDDTAPGQIVADDLATNKDNEIVYPGQGMLLNTLGTRQLTFGGNDVSYVKESPTKVPLYGGKINLAGLVNPVVAATPLGAVAANEATPVNAPAYGLVDSGLVEFEDEIAHFGLNPQGNFARLGLYYYDQAADTIVDATTFAPVTAPIANGTALLLKPSGNRYFTQPGVVVGN